MEPLVKKVAVIGAGIAGIGAATTLLENGCNDIVVLEAQSKPGGRIQTITYEYGVLDLGAQWIHGKDNSLFRVAEQHSLTADYVSEEGLGKYVRDDGYVFDNMFVEKVNFEIGKILYACEAYDGDGTLPKSVGEYLEHEFKTYLDKCEDTDEVRNMKLEILEWNVRFQVVDNSCIGLNEVSAKGWGKYVCYSEEKYINLKSGLGSAVDKLLENIPDDVILLNTPVLTLDYENVDNNNHVILTCKNGQTVFAEHVILTPSLGVLKTFTDIKPPLPAEISDTIECLGFNGVGKIFLVFDKIWWDSEGFQLVWRQNVSVRKEEEWTKSITGFETVYNNPHVLVGWVGGKSVEIMERLAKDQVSTHCIKLLRRFLPTRTIPDPINIYRTTWLSNPWIRGGYSHISTACDRLGATMDRLSEPVTVNGVPRILLAGEAVHPTFFSTAHGAYESGQQQANALCQYLSETVEKFSNTPKEKSCP